MTDPKEFSDAAVDRYYAPSEVCNCEEPCPSEAYHKARVEAAYDAHCEQEFERRREAGL